MSFIVRDFECKKCGLIFEDFVKRDETSTPCKQCNEPSDMTISTPMISALCDPDKKRELLKKRSEEHSAKEMKHNVGKFAKYGISGQSTAAWNIRKK
jgi:hypothetical protein